MEALRRMSCTVPYRYLPLQVPIPEAPPLSLSLSLSLQSGADHIGYVQSTGKFSGHGGLGGGLWAQQLLQCGSNVVQWSRYHLSVHHH